MIRPRAYRYPNERLILALTLLLFLAVIVFTAAATLCLSVIFIGLFVVMAYNSSLNHHRSLVLAAQPVTPRRTPALNALVAGCAARLRPGSLEVFIAPSRALNAYTFGLSSPKVLVLYSALLDIMDEDELRFIIGHEMGHVALGHTWLNSLVGGMAGIPSNSLSSALLTMALLWWNRTCELSADRAGLLVCRSPEKAVTALVKLVAGPAGLTQAGLQAAYQRIDAQDDTWLGNLTEALGSHPMLIRRINALQRYAASEQYRRLVA